MSVNSSNAVRPTLKPMPIAHPLVIVISLSVIAGMLYWGFKTDFQQPDPWLAFSVSLMILFVGHASYRRASKRSSGAPRVPPPLRIESR
jgi:divalent metal cation (Fe/Co/Zn/Cd) transporter